MDRLCGLALCAADEALAQADIPSGEGAAVLFGSAYGCHSTDEAFYEGLIEKERRLIGASPRLFSYTLPSSPAGEISIHYGLKGPGLAVVSGLTAGLEVLEEALRCAALGRASHLLVAAADTGSPSLDRIEGGVPDAACALLLGKSDAGGPCAPLGYLREVQSAFCPGNPQQALVQAMRCMATQRDSKLDGVSAYADEPTRTLLRAARLPVRLEEGAGAWPTIHGSCAPLLALSRLAESAGDSALVVSCDIYGSSAVAAWSRSA
jgi:hypothetical protein